MSGACRCGGRAIEVPVPEAIMDHATEYAIRRLIHRSSELHDQGRVEELAGLFRHGEIVLAGVAEVFRGVDGAREVLRRTVFYDANGEPADPGEVYATPRAMHYITNLDVYRDAGGTVCASSQFIVLRQREQGPQPVIGGRYLDTFAQIADAYWFRRRVTEVHLVGDSVGYLTMNPWRK